MNISDAMVVYYVRYGEKAGAVNTSKSSLLKSKNGLRNDKIAILKDSDGRRLACVIETKKGYTIDVVKKLHQ